MSSNYHRRCAICSNTRAEDMAITFHRFPKPGKLNIIKAQTWAKYCWPTKDWTSLESLHSLYTSNKVLCGRHFSTSHFYDSERQKLSIYAVPDIIDTRHSSIIQESDVNQPSLGITNASKPTTIEENAHYVVETCKSGEIREQPQYSSDKRKGILSLINVSKLSELTPRELMLYKICQKNIKEIRRLRKILKNKKDKCVKSINRKRKCARSMEFK